MILLLATTSYAQNPPLDPCALNPIYCDLQLVPDLVTMEVTGGCRGMGGPAEVNVRVGNVGSRSGAAWVDLFLDHPFAPSVGDEGDQYKWSGTVSTSTPNIVSFAIDEPANSQLWVDVVLDTFEDLDESDETNNVYTVYFTVPDCSFH